MWHSFSAKAENLHENRRKQTVITGTEKRVLFDVAKHFNQKQAEHNYLYK